MVLASSSAWGSTTLSSPQNFTVAAASSPPPKANPKPKSALLPPQLVNWLVIGGLVVAAGAIVRRQAKLMKRLDPDPVSDPVTLPTAIPPIHAAQSTPTETEATVITDPDQASLYTQQADLFLSSGNLPAALQAYETAKQFDPQLPPVAPQFAQALLEDGSQLRASGNLEAAMTQLQAALQANPPEAPVTAEIHYQMGLIFSQQKALDQALDQFQIALEQDPHLAKAHQSLGETLLQKRELDSAIDVFWQALDQDPQLAAAHHHMGIALYKKGQLRAAMAAYHTALDMYAAQPAPELHLDLGFASLQSGDVTAAKKEFVPLLSHPLVGSIASLGLGHVLAAEGLYEEALAAFEAALRTDPTLSAATAAIGLIYLTQKQQDASGRKFIQARQVEAAQAQFEAVLKQDPLQPEAHYGTGEILRFKGNLLLAIQSYQTAIGSNGSFTAAHFRMGSVYARLGRLDLAIESLCTTLQLNPNYPDAQDALSRVYAKQRTDPLLEFSPSTELLPR